MGSTVGNAVGTPTPAMPTSACRHPLKKIPASGVEGGSFGGSGGGELEREDSREALLLTHFAVQSNLTLSDLTSPGVVKGGLDLAARGHEVHSGLAVVRIAVRLSNRLELGRYRRTLHLRHEISL